VRREIRAVRITATVDDTRERRSHVLGVEPERLQTQSENRTQPTYRRTRGVGDDNSATHRLSAPTGEVPLDYQGHHEHSTGLAH